MSIFWSATLGGVCLGLGGLAVAVAMGRLRERGVGRRRTAVIVTPRGALSTRRASDIASRGNLVSHRFRAKPPPGTGKTPHLSGMTFIRTTHAMNTLAFDPQPMDQLVAPAAVATDDWLWQGYLARGNITLLTSVWKSGKTTLLAGLLRALGGGEPFLGRPCAAASALVVSEESAAHWAERTRAIPVGPRARLVSRPFVGRPTPDQWDELVVNAECLRVDGALDVFVVDPLASFLPGRSESDPGTLLEMLHPLRRLAQAGVAVLVLHHPRKKAADEGSIARGSGALLGFVDVVLELHRCGCLLPTPTAGGWPGSRAARIRRGRWSTSGCQGQPSSGRWPTRTRPGSGKTGRRCGPFWRHGGHRPRTRNCWPTGRRTECRRRPANCTSGWAAPQPRGWSPARAAGRAPTRSASACRARRRLPGPAPAAAAAVEVVLPSLHRSAVLSSLHRSAVQRLCGRSAVWPPVPIRSRPSLGRHCVGQVWPRSGRKHVTPRSGVTRGTPRSGVTRGWTLFRVT